MFAQPVVFVDIETTGGSYRTSRVLEVAVVRVENGREVAVFSQVVNPDMQIPPSITQLTGINQDHVHGAPRFADIADQLLDVLSGALFIAHNVRFDYSFLKNEFALVGIEFSPRLLCTVRLSRALYSTQRGHSLQKLIERHNIAFTDRHRAEDDARAIQQFAAIAWNEHGDEAFNEAVARQLKTQYAPPNIPEDQIAALPNTPGVYIFRNEQRYPLYVGKSVRLKDRVMSHFRDTSPRELKISQHVHTVETIETSGELTALVLESKLIKELQPLHNKKLRRVSKYAMLVKMLNDGYAQLSVTSGAIGSDTNLSDVYGVYTTRTKAKKRVEELTRTFNLCPKRMGIEKTSNACFSYRLGRCRGACIRRETSELYNRRFELALTNTKLQEWPYDSAIAVPINQAGEMVIIKNWMIEGYIDEHGERVYSDNELGFDVDEYKILRRFIRENKDRIVKFIE